MDELMNMRHLTRNNGYWQYERRVPKAVLTHPYWNEKKSWKRPLGLKVDAPVTEVIILNLSTIHESSLGHLMTS